VGAVEEVEVTGTDSEADASDAEDGSEVEVNSAICCASPLASSPEAEGGDVVIIVMA